MRALASALIVTGTRDGFELNQALLGSAAIPLPFEPDRDLPLNFAALLQ